MTDRDPSASSDADRDSLTRAFDQNRESVESLVDRLDTADELLGAALRSVRTLRDDADAPTRERPDADAGPTPKPSIGADGDDVAAAVTTAAELHREGALAGVTDAVSKEDVARGVEAFLDAYGDPDVEGGTGYLVAVVTALGGDPDGREEEHGAGGDAPPR